MSPLRLTDQATPLRAPRACTADFGSPVVTAIMLPPHPQEDRIATFFDGAFARDSFATFRDPDGNTFVLSSS